MGWDLCPSHSLLGLWCLKQWLAHWTQLGICQTGILPAWTQEPLIGPTSPPPSSLGLCHPCFGASRPPPLPADEICPLAPAHQTPKVQETSGKGRGRGA